jgi:hypothetical protein
MRGNSILYPSSFFYSRGEISVVAESSSPMPAISFRRILKQKIDGLASKF